MFYSQGGFYGPFKKRGVVLTRHSHIRIHITDFLADVHGDQTPIIDVRGDGKDHTRVPVLDGGCRYSGTT